VKRTSGETAGLAGGAGLTAHGRARAPCGDLSETSPPPPPLLQFHTPAHAPARRLFYSIPSRRLLDEETLFYDFHACTGPSKREEPCVHAETWKIRCRLSGRTRMEE